MQKAVFTFIFIASFFQVLAQDQPKADTIEIGGVVIIRDNAPPPQPEKKGFLKKLSSRANPKDVKTQWGIVDIGVSNFVDKTNYADADAQHYAPLANEEWLGLKPFKSRNVNIWVVTQRFNLINHFVNFQYGLGVELNNYHYKQPIRYEAQTPAVTNAPVIYLDKTLDRTYTKNKLAADYITAPVMLNFNLTPYRLYPFEISAGVSAGYLYSARNKFINSDEGKSKTRGDFDLRPWKLSYIAELNLGVVRLYGSYAFKSMYMRGLDIVPYNFGIRIKPIEAFGKIEVQ
ncbi:outer membrane beta-barrel protein [Niabella insulamsoli]|uniref:outer membrane beta-barrel protein n=1 Tax=Niabella insulamsoli TaxID=3144874 RepID=UPI0031FD5037